VVGTLADYKALTGQDLTTEGVGSATVTAADQDGTRGGPAVPTTDQPAVTRDCPYCKSSVPADATRCAFCTSALEPALAVGGV